MTFQEKLVILRKNNKLTQDDFAKAVGVSRQAVYKWENGTSYPEIQKLLEMRDLFNISLDDLFDDSFEVEAPEKKKRRRAVAPKAEAPVVEEVPAVEAAPAVEEAPAVEAAPAVEEAPVVEAAPAVEEAPASEAAPVVEEKPEIKEEPIVKERSDVKAERAALSRSGDAKEDDVDRLRRVDVPVEESENDEIVAEAAQEKKVGFFERLFGRR